MERKTSIALQERKYNSKKSAGVGAAKIRHKYSAPGRRVANYLTLLSAKKTRTTNYNRFSMHKQNTNKYEGEKETKRG